MEVASLSFLLVCPFCPLSSLMSPYVQMPPQCSMAVNLKAKTTSLMSCHWAFPSPRALDSSGSNFSGALKEPVAVGWPGCHRWQKFGFFFLGCRHWESYNILHAQVDLPCNLIPLCLLMPSLVLALQLNYRSAVPQWLPEYLPCLHAERSEQILVKVYCKKSVLKRWSLKAFHYKVFSFQLSFK